MPVIPIRDIAMPQRCHALRTWKLSGSELRAWIDRCRCDLERLSPAATDDDRRRDVIAVAEALRASEACRTRFGQVDGRKVEEALLTGLRKLLRYALDDDPLVLRILSLPPDTGDVLVDRARAVFQASHDYIAALRSLKVPVD